MKTILLMALLLGALLPAAAEDKPLPKATPKDPARGTAEEKGMTAEEFEASLEFRRGKITLGDGLAVLNVPEGFRYLDPEQAERLLVDAWGNPPGAKTLGMLLPGAGVVGDAAWGVVITYDEDGYVKDDEADEINYDELLAAMRESTREGNEERRKLGYEPVELVGWAAPPRYDRAAHKLYWAKELKFGDAAERTLNYDIRALGRRGVLSLNAVASAGQLKQVEAAMQDVLKIVEFNEGHRYSDYVPGVDAAKAGLFKVLLGALLAGKKFVLLGLAAVGALLWKFFKGKSGSQPEDSKA
jgi:uncharacterized membrane-anchored protein